MAESTSSGAMAPRGPITRALDWIERIGNKLPDPALLFLLLLFVVWVIPALIAPMTFEEIDPRTKEPIRVQSQLTGTALATFLARMVTTFTSFHPLGVVLVSLLGVGIAEHTGFINAGLKQLLSVTSARLLTPMVIAVGILSHTAADAGYVLVIPLGGVIFHAAGRQPLAGIAAAFAGVSGGFSATFIPSSLDPLLAGLTQAAAQLLDPARTVNPLSNYYYTTASAAIIIALGWFVTDRIVVGEVGAARPDLRADADDARPLAGTDAGRVSRGGFVHEHHHAADAVLPAGRRLLPEVREVDGHRHAGVDDAPVLDRVPAGLDGVPHDLLDGGDTAGAAGALRVSQLA